MFQCLIEVHVTLKVPVLQPRDADIENHRVRFDPATRNQPRFSDGNGQNIGALDVGFKVPREFVANCGGRAGEKNSSASGRPT